MPQIDAHSTRLIQPYLSLDEDELDTENLAVAGPPQANAAKFKPQGILDMFGWLSNKFEKKPKDCRGCCREAFTDSDHFFLAFREGAGLTPQQKATTMASLVLVDYSRHRQPNPRPARPARRHPARLTAPPRRPQCCSSRTTACASRTGRACASPSATSTAAAASARASSTCRRKAAARQTTARPRAPPTAP